MIYGGTLAMLKLSPLLLSLLTALLLAGCHHGHGC